VIPELNDGELSVIQHLKKKALNVQKVAVALAMKEMVQTYVDFKAHQQHITLTIIHLMW
jgi:hypothetical protein